MLTFRLLARLTFNLSRMRNESIPFDALDNLKAFLLSEFGLPEKCLHEVNSFLLKYLYHILHSKNVTLHSSLHKV